MATTPQSKAPDADERAPRAEQHPDTQSIRLATQDDAGALARLAQELLTFYGLPLRNQRSYMTHVIEAGAFDPGSGLRILIAYDGQEEIGFLAFSEIFALAACQKSIFIQDLFVTRKARGTGAGRALMAELIKHAEETKVTQIDWTTDPWNSKAASFYESFGPLLKSEKIFYRLPADRLKSLVRKLD